MHFYELALGILCVWRITHLLQAEGRPWEIVARLRSSIGQGFWGSLLDCFYCLSLWIAVPFAVLLGESIREQLLLWPALSAGAILLERMTNREQESQSAEYFEDQEDEHGMLRPK